jgi:hypothetical protein
MTENEIAALPDFKTLAISAGSSSPWRVKSEEFEALF